MKLRNAPIVTQAGVGVLLIAGLYLFMNGLRPPPQANPATESTSTAVPATLAANSTGEIHQTLPSGLRIEEYALAGGPSLEPLTFTTLQGTQPEIFFLPSTPLNTRANQSFDAASRLTSSVDVGTDKISVTELEGDGTALGHGVTLQVARNGQVIATLPAGDSSPIGTLRGLWAYNQHWVLEFAHVTNSIGADNGVSSDAVGQIFQDGVLLNERNSYQAAFGFQTMNGRPFYFFKRDGQIGVVFDGQETLLGYNAVPHYGCCSAAEENPRTYVDGITFFAQRAGRWYYVDIGLNKTP
jgi:hypothetical protein